MPSEPLKMLALIPHYRHPATIAQVVAAMRSFDLPVLVVDDGSGEACRDTLLGLAQQEGVHVLFRPSNGGKGAAMKMGLKYARTQGYSHVLQVDADAQHCLSDTEKFIQAATAQPQALVCGWPQYGDDAPKARLYGRKITNFWNMLHTWSTDIKDGMCGFRLYPLDAACAVVCEEYVGDRMDYDVEILVHLYWRGVPLVWIPTPVKYEAGGVSHFQSVADNLRISKMHARLFLGMLARRLGGRK